MNKKNQIIYVIIAIVIAIYLIAKLGNAITQKARRVQSSTINHQQRTVDLLRDKK